MSAQDVDEPVSGWRVACSFSCLGLLVPLAVLVVGCGVWAHGRGEALDLILLLSAAPALMIAVGVYYAAALLRPERAVQPPPPEAPEPAPPEREARRALDALRAVLAGGALTSDEVTGMLGGDDVCVRLERAGERSAEEVFTCAVRTLLPVGLATGELARDHADPRVSSALKTIFRRCRKVHVTDSGLEARSCPPGSQAALDTLRALALLAAALWARPQAPEAGAITVTARARESCPYCREGIAGEDDVACERCGTAHHRACFEEHGRCTIHGCGQTRSRARTPAS